MKPLYVRDIDISGEVVRVERLKPEDVENLKDISLLCLSLGLTKKEAELLLENKPLHELFIAPYKELADLFNRSQAMKILLYMELAKRVYKKGLSIRPTISCPAETLAFLSEIKDKSKEHFLSLYLNARHQVIKKEVISIGTLSASIVHPREVFQPAIINNAACIILAHNHPSGDPAPSQDDIELTKRLKQAGDIIGIEVLDHIIVSSDDFISLKEQGVL